MSVLDVDMVDYVYLDDDTQTPVLVVSDPLSWKPVEEQKHLEALREKLNAQIAFVETGQIEKVWPDYDGRQVKVEVVARHSLTEAAKEFYSRAKSVMTQANMDLQFHLCDA